MDIKSLTQYLHEYSDKKAYAVYRTNELENAAFPPVIFKAD